MSVFTSLRDDLGGILEHKIRLQFYLGSNASTGFDDAQVMTKSGTANWVSGLVLPIKALEGSKEAVLIQQGKIKTSDKRVYIKGNVSTLTPSPGALKIGVGSPTPTEHFIVPAGEEAWPPSTDTNEIVYKKLFCRELPNGSFAGE